MTTTPDAAKLIARLLEEAESFGGPGERDPTAKALVELFTETAEWIKGREARIEQLERERAALTDLGRRISSDTLGVFHYAEDAVREAMGNTNFNVIKGWAEELAALTSEQGNG